MKKIFSVLFAVVLVLSFSLVAPVPVGAATTIVVCPAFNDHSIAGAVTELSTEQTVLGAHSAKLSIPGGVIGDQYNLGIDTSVLPPAEMATLASYEPMSFKANIIAEGRTAWLYSGLILYDVANDVLVSLMPDGTTEGDPDANGWRTVTPGRTDTLSPSNKVRWSAYTFGGQPWPLDHSIWPATGGAYEVIYYPWSGPIMPLTDWDTYLASMGINVQVKLVQIKWGFNPYASGTVYVDELTVGDVVTYDLEPSSAGAVSLTVELQEIIGISVTPTSIDFGILYPGQSSAVHIVTVSNVGTVTVDVGVSLSRTDTVFNYLQLSSQNVPKTDLITDLAVGGSQGVNAQLVVPSTYSAKGTETATLIFEASAP